MSNGLFDLLAAARHYRAGGPGPKATLMAVMERVGLVDGEWVCWPGNATVAYDSEQSVPSVRRHLAQFEAAGLITRRRRGREGGGRDWNLIVVDVERLTQCAHDARIASEAMRASEGGPKRSSRGTKALIQGDESAHPPEPAPYIEQPEEPEEQPEPSPNSSFAAFWLAYPTRDGKKIGKAAAQEAWDRMREGERAAALVGARHLAAAVAAGGRFGVKDPERFLKKRCWEDWQEPAAVASPPPAAMPIPPSQRISTNTKAGGMKL